MFSKGKKCKYHEKKDSQAALRPSKKNDSPYGSSLSFQSVFSSRNGVTAAVAT